LRTTRAADSVALRPNHPRQYENSIGAFPCDEHTVTQGVVSENSIEENFSPDIQEEIFFLPAVTDGQRARWTAIRSVQ
jgi:hypothetical protein